MHITVENCVTKTVNFIFIVIQQVVNWSWYSQLSLIWTSDLRNSRFMDKIFWNKMFCFPLILIILKFRITEYSLYGHDFHVTNESGLTRVDCTSFSMRIREMNTEVCPVKLMLGLLLTKTHFSQWPCSQFESVGKISHLNIIHSMHLLQ